MLNSRLRFGVLNSVRHTKNFKFAHNLFQKVTQEEKDFPNLLKVH